MYSRPMSLVVMVRVLVVRDTPYLLAQYSRTCIVQEVSTVQYSSEDTTWYCVLGTRFVSTCSNSSSPSSL